MEQIPINVPLRCPLSMRRMEFPARGQHCQHIRVSSTVYENLLKRRFTDIVALVL